MIKLKPITYENIGDLNDTSYETIPLEQKKKMVEESNNKMHNESYFEIFAVYNDNIIVGFMNLYAHSAHIISCAPEIKKCYKRQGFGFLAELLALDYAKGKGYTIAVGSVDDNNIASIALHEKLGFEMDRKYLNGQGRNIRIYIKAL